MSVRVLLGHVLDVLEREPAGNVHAVVCSPPYWQLRAYGTPPQVWPDGWVGELGQEDTPERFVEHLVAVFRAVKRVLRDDGTLWVNLGGNFWNDAGGQNGASVREGGPRGISPKAIEANAQQGRTQKLRGGHPVYKPLDYVDMPGLVARALQADGWLWRSDVALVKSAPMPESVSGTRWERCRVSLRPAVRSKDGRGGSNPAHEQRPGNFRNETEATLGTMAQWADCPGCPRCAANGGLLLRRGSGRPTRAWERLLVFAKRPGYYFDCEAIREASVSPEQEAHNQRYARVYERYDEETAPHKQPGNTNHKGIHSRPGQGGRNARDWLLWKPAPLKAEGNEAEHYAAYPPQIPELAVKAGTSARGCCPRCGAPWARVVERTPSLSLQAAWNGVSEQISKGVSRPGEFVDAQTTTLDWRPTCACPPHTPRPAVVMDCFGGSGTSGIVADRLGRDAVLVELKPQYAALALSRVTRDAPLLLWGQVRLEQSTTPSVAEGVPLLLEDAEDAVAGG